MRYLLISIFSPSLASGYDFGYLLRALTNQKLPEHESDFFQLLSIFFSKVYDVKYLMKSCKNLKGGLQEVADQLKVMYSFFVCEFWQKYFFAVSFPSTISFFSTISLSSYHTLLVIVVTPYLAWHLHRFFCKCKVDWPKVGTPSKGIIAFFIVTYTMERLVTRKTSYFSVT